MTEYRFTADQLCKLLDGTVELFVEYIEQHGHSAVSARAHAVQDITECLDLERELWEQGEIFNPSQVLP